MGLLLCPRQHRVDSQHQPLPPLCLEKPQVVMDQGIAMHLVMLLLPLPLSPLPAHWQVAEAG